MDDYIYDRHRSYNLHCDLEPSPVQTKCKLCPWVVMMVRSFHRYRLQTNLTSFDQHMANCFLVNLKLSRSNNYGRAYIIRMQNLKCFFMSIGPTPLVSSFHAPMQIDPMFICASVSKDNFVSRTPSLFNAKLQVASARSAVLFDYSRPYQKVQ